VSNVGRKVIQQAAICQPHAIHFDWRQDARHGHCRAHGKSDQSILQDDLLTTVQVNCHQGERQVQIGKGALTELTLKVRQQPLALEQALLRQAQIGETGEATPVRCR